ncbi:divergent PAP2 family protein [Chloroflexota bacterium]
MPFDKSAIIGLNRKIPTRQDYQEVVLNRIVRELRLRRPLTELGRDLKEFVGHTQFQVIIGTLLGIIITWSWLAIAGDIPVAKLVQVK